MTASTGLKLTAALLLAAGAAGVTAAALVAGTAALIADAAVPATAALCVGGGNSHPLGGNNRPLF